MFNTQTIEHPFGITVFGSSVVRHEPDIASVTFAVSRLAQQPRDAFREAREGAQAVRNYLEQAKISEVNSSRVTLAQSIDYSSRERRLLGYTALISFSILVRDLDILENVLTGIVDAGANELDRVVLQTSRIKELRADARRLAVEAAREKAENYCSAAGVSLGPVIHIMDVNPDDLQEPESHRARGIAAGGGGQASGAIEPGHISVAGTVVVAFELGSKL